MVPFPPVYNTDLLQQQQQKSKSLRTFKTKSTTLTFKKIPTHRIRTPSSWHKTRANPFRPLSPTLIQFQHIQPLLRLSGNGILWSMPQTSKVAPCSVGVVWNLVFTWTLNPRQQNDYSFSSCCHYCCCCGGGGGGSSDHSHGTVTGE